MELFFHCLLLSDLDGCDRPPMALFVMYPQANVFDFLHSYSQLVVVAWIINSFCPPPQTFYKN